MTSINQLRWQCRRGTLELDILLQRYLDRCFEGAGSEERAAFINLLKLEDSKLLLYLTGHQAPDAEDLAGIVCQIKKLNHTGDISGG